MNRVKNTVPIFLGILILANSSGIWFAPSNFQSANAEPAKRIVGYVPNWEFADFASIDYSKVTDVIYFHIWPNADGSLDTSGINLNYLQSVRDDAHASGVNVLIAVGGGGVSQAFPEMAQSDNSRAQFVSNVLDFVLSNDLDGADIDWETAFDQAKIDNQDALLSDLAVALHPQGKLLTVAANGEVAELKSSASNYVDWVNVMAYDMNWGTAEHSTYSDSIAALGLYESVGIPKEKLALGIPFYGRDDNTQAMKYETIISTCHPDPSVNYCNGYFFNGIDLVNQKVQYVLDDAYFGVMIWNLGQDTYDQTSLLDAINSTLAGSPTPNTLVFLENLQIIKSGNKRWSATVTITVIDENTNPVSGATVSGLWSGGSSGNDTCITDSSGQCNVSKSTNGNNLTFTVNDIFGNKMTYDPSSNMVSNSISINKDGTTSGQNSPPVADAGGPYYGSKNNPIAFDGSGSSDTEGSITYLWEFGDGNSSTEKNPNHTYFSDGTFDVILTVTDTENLTDTDSTFVTTSSQTSSLAISGISPNSMLKGDTIQVTVIGSGFDQNATVEFSGEKYSPMISSTNVVDQNTIEMEITSSTAGPKKDFVYDLTVANPNGDSVTLVNSFTVLN